MCMFSFVSLDISTLRRNFAFWGHHQARRSAEGKDLIFSLPMLSHHLQELIPWKNYSNPGYPAIPVYLFQSCQK